LREFAAEQSAGEFAAAARDLRLALACIDDIAIKIELGVRLRYALLWSHRAQEVATAVDAVIDEAVQHDSEAALLLQAAVAGAQLVDLSTSLSERVRARDLVQPALACEPAPAHVSSLA
jgi:hypothetical protein